MTAPQTRFVDQFTGRLAGRPSKFFQALSEADEFIRQLDRGTVAQADADDAAETISLLMEERDELKDWRFRVAEALGLTDTVEGVGHVVVVNSTEEAVEFAQHYTETALKHERDCPVFCDGCEHYEMSQSCKRCGGSGCGPGTASGAYEPCGDCDGDGRDHAAGYFSHPCDAHADLRCRIQELEAERDAAITEREHWRGVAHNWMARR